MLKKACVCSISGLIVLVGSLPCQRTWVVDQAGGGDFTDLPMAVQTAQDGDTILVKPGSYQGATTGKALRILGMGPGKPTLTRFIASSVPSGKELTLSNFDGESAGAENNAGRVVFDRLSMTGAPDTVFVKASRHVVIRSSLFSGHGKVFRDSTVLISDSSFVARGYVEPGLWVFDCWLECANLRAKGSNEHPTNWFLVAMPGLLLQRTSLRLAGGGTLIEAGWSSTAIDTIAADARSTIRMDPAVRILSGWGRPISGTKPLIYPIGTVIGSSGPPGTTMTVDVAALPGSGILLFMSPLSERLQLGFGTLWIDPGWNALIDSGVVGPTGLRQRMFPLSPSISRGLAVRLQAGVISGGKLSVSTPETVVMH